MSHIIAVDSKDAQEKLIDEVFSKVEAWFHSGDQEGQNIFRDFASKHAPAFDFSTGEQKLEYTQIYNEFTQVFESKVEGKPPRCAFT